MASFIVNVDVLWASAAKSKCTTIAEIAAVTGLSERTVWAALNGKPKHASTLLKLARKLGLGDDYSALIANPQKGMSEGQGAERPFDEKDDKPTTAAATNLADGRTQDIKVLVASAQICKSLLQRGPRPTFLDCVLHSVAFTPIDDKHKDYPFVPQSKYNHFFQPSAVVVIQQRKDMYVLACKRTAQDGSPDYLHTQGRSILFASDYLRKVHRHRQSPMDRWVQIANRDKKKGVRDFLDKEGTLVQILQYKIDLLQRASLVEPLGVISNDQRAKGSNRVYTQFVFRIDVRLKDREDIDRAVRAISAPGLVLSRLPGDLDPEAYFVGRAGRKNAMDILAWQTLHSSERQLKYQSARFTRGFDVV